VAPVESRPRGGPAQRSRSVLEHRPRTDLSEHDARALDAFHRRDSPIGPPIATDFLGLSYEVKDLPLVASLGSRGNYVSLRALGTGVLTCGKIERLHQTLKRYLAKQVPATTLKDLQRQLDAFVHSYNHIRPHRALQGRTPLQAYSARINAQPAGRPANTYFRVRQDKVDATGKVSLRHLSRLYKIGVGRAHKGRPVKLLIADQQIRVIDLDGQLLRQLTLDPSRTYQRITAA
jgi:Integrase core domain